MSEGYTKLFSDIVDSSIWDENPQTCKVWITLLALSNADGYVRGSPSWLAAKARVSPDACQVALTLLASPDPRSRTPDNEGRRIESLEDGWLILNYLAFRDRLSTNPQAVRVRERVRAHRERYKALRNAQSVTSVTLDHSASASASVPVSSIRTQPQLVARSRGPNRAEFDSAKSSSPDYKLDPYIREKLASMPKLSEELMNGTTVTATRFASLFSRNPDAARELIGECRGKAAPGAWLNKVLQGGGK